MKDRWFVTWRHANTSPLDALTTLVDSKEDGERLQAEYLRDHAESLCYPCTMINGGNAYIHGDNKNIVTKVRTEKAVYKTLGF